MGLTATELGNPSSASEVSFKLGFVRLCESNFYTTLIIE